MSPQDLKIVIRNMQSGDAEAFVAFVSFLQRDLRVLIASFASSPSMVDSVTVETWSDCQGHIDQCPASMAAISWLRVTACKHLVRRLEAELVQERSRKDSLKLLIIPSALEQFNTTPTPSNAQGNKVQEKIQKLDQNVQDLLTRRYAQGLTLEKCVAELGEGATLATVARTLFLARESLDWRDSDHVSFANADGKFVALIEEYLAGTISPESRERLQTLTDHDRIRAMQFERQVRIDMILTALLSSAGTEDAQRLISRLTGASPVRRPSARNPSQGEKAPVSSDLPSPSSSRTAPNRPLAQAERGINQRNGRNNQSFIYYWVGGALLVVILVAFFAMKPTTANPPGQQSNTEPAPGDGRRIIAPAKDLGQDGQSAPLQASSRPTTAGLPGHVKDSAHATTSNALHEGSDQSVSQGAHVDIARTDGDWTDLTIGPPVVGEGCDSSETHGAVVSWVEGFCPPYMNGNAIGRLVPQLIDLSLPTSNDDIARNVWFDGPESRIVVDLQKNIDVSRVATYSWHKSNRAMQLFTLWGAAGEALPNAGLIDLSGKWIRLAQVDTTSLKEGGKQGSSITSPTGSLGRFRWLLWQSPPRHEGTFYSKLCVFDRNRIPP
jgi:DNA-directed RNA polymerase specialized sigma24 family protein